MVSNQLINRVRVGNFQLSRVYINKALYNFFIDVFFLFNLNGFSYSLSRIKEAVGEGSMLQSHGDLLAPSPFLHSAFLSLRAQGEVGNDLPHP